jgi:hypothetical protein
MVEHHPIRMYWKRFACTVMLAVTAVVCHAAEHMHAPGEVTGNTRPRPQLAISAAMAPDGRLWVAGVTSEDRLYVRTADAPGSMSLGDPRILNTAGDRISAEGENRPKVVFGPKGWVVVTYTQPLSKPYTGEIRMLRSDDGGKSFSAPFTVHQDRQIITHRFESVAFDEQGTLHTLWIDKRDAEALRQKAGSDKSSRARTQYRGAAVYRNESNDGGRTFGPDIKVADHSCECCRIALAPSPAGGFAAMWRHVFAPNERDHAFVLLRTHTPAQPVVRATYDRWALDACPHHGPGLVPSVSGGYHAVWFGDRTGKMRARYGRLHADGTPSGEVFELPDPHAEHADVRAVGNTIVISWKSFDGTATHWKAWISRDSGNRFELKNVAATKVDNDYPVLLISGRSILGLWNTTEGMKIETLAN